MATKPAPAQTGDAKPVNKSKKTLLIVIGLVVVLVLGGAGAFLFLANKKAHDDNGDDDFEAAPAAPVKKVHVDKSQPPTFVPLEPFTVNLQPDNEGEQYLQLVLNFRAANAKLGDEIKAYMPELRHHILMLLSSKKASEVNSVDGRESLANQICVEANRVLGYEPPPKKNGKHQDNNDLICEGPITSVLFTSFIVQ
ncbi:MAG: flagellar basal body-associated FliL family protein [Betaproteobacteria bacterium]|nr:flagellar basal body-associated FliL family protein [Betaproteobacteria bacterium]